MALTLSAGCLGSRPPKGPAIDPELAQQSASARLAFQRGETDQAVALYRRALDRAREMDDAGEIAKAGYNVAAALIRDGRYDAARAVLREAEAETLRSGANAADVLLLEAKVAHLQDEPADALALADRVMTDKASKPDDGHQLQVHVLRGDVNMDLGQVDLAQQELTRAAKFASKNDPPALRAGPVGLDARLHLARGDRPAAARLFDEEADLLRQAGLYRDMARALDRSATALRDAAQFAPAAERYYRAGRSFAAQGDAAEGRRLLRAAADMARLTNDPELSARIRVLQDAVRDDGPPTTRPTGFRLQSPASEPASSK